MSQFLEKIKAHPGVESIDDGRAAGDVLFVCLGPHYAFGYGGHASGFETIWEAYRAVREIKHCDCERCREQAELRSKAR